MQPIDYNADSMAMSGKSAQNYNFFNILSNAVRCIYYGLDFYIDL